MLLEKMKQNNLIERIINEVKNTLFYNAIGKCFQPYIFSNQRLQIAKDRICINYSYLRNKAFGLYNNDYTKERAYINDHIKVGLDYGFTDEIKLSLIPDFRLENSENSETLNISPSIGFQAMKSSEIPYFEWMNYHIIGSTRIEVSRLREGMPYNMSIHGILGAGIFYELKLNEKLTLVTFSDIYYEPHFVNIFNTHLELDSGIYILTPRFVQRHIPGIEFGLELGLWYEITLIGKYSHKLLSENEVNTGFFTLSLSVKK